MINNSSLAPIFDIEPLVHALPPSGFSAHELISEETYSTYGLILQEYSDSSIEDSDWNIPYMDGLKNFGVHFNSLDVSETELHLIKAYIVDTLSHYSSPSTCINRLKYLTYLFRFLHEKNFGVRMLSTPIINLFRLWLDADNSLSAERKNDIESVLKSFVPFLQELKLVRPGNIVIPAPRPLPIRDVVRAPEKEIMYSLDKYFFDFAHQIPSAYRCIYLIARLIPVRSNEVLSISIDGFRIKDDLVELWIPTYKETPTHELIYEPYYRFASEYPECIMLRALQEQQKFALDHQAEIIKDANKCRLMVSNKNPTRLVSADEFNSYLKAVCKELNVVDYLGNPTTITMYSLRHANGAEMSFNPAISASEFTRAFSHASQAADVPYAFGSKRDEMKRISKATQKVRDQLTSAIPSSETIAHMVSKSRLEKMQKDYSTRLIGRDSVCQQKGCTPQFNRCVQCENYVPDPKYIPDAEACCEILRQRLEKCTSDDQRKLSEEQLKVYLAFIARATT